MIRGDGRPGRAVGRTVRTGRFTVRLTNFDGPFDLLLQLIGKHKLDVTEVALHRVTDDFIAYIRAMGDDWDLDEASEFLVIAATLLDLKAARLLPAAEVENEEDLALLEARDLLFARLLQYRAFKQAAAVHRRPGGHRRPPLAALGLAGAAVRRGAARPGARHRRRTGWPNWRCKAFTPKAGPAAGVDRAHPPGPGQRPRTRRTCCATGCFELGTRHVQRRSPPTARTPWRWWPGSWHCWSCTGRAWSSFDQELALGELMVRWTGGDDGGRDLEVDEYDGDDEADTDEATWRRARRTWVETADERPSRAGHEPAGEDRADERG